ncbi:MAG: arylsulfatase [Xanthomonadales bacterium]|nr:arylsulfatase [Xanthomonadales bacterium]
MTSGAPSASAQVQAPGPGRPNIVLINADDVGYGDVGVYGAERIRTPNIDSLAREGMRFTDAHSASAVCSPSRYALLTGEYPFRRDFWFPIFATAPLVVDPSTTTLASLLKDVGYATAAIGKWHLGFGNKEPVDWNGTLSPGPLELGFDYYFGVPVLNSHPPFVYVENRAVLGLDPADPLVYGEMAITRYFDEKFDYDTIGGGLAAHRLYRDREVGTTLTEKAVNWIRSQQDQPFFLYFASTNIHHPFTPAPRFIGSSGAGPYGDSMHELDWMVGQILQALDDSQVRDNTLVLFISDNGGMFNRGGQTAWETGHRLNGDLLGLKFGAWEGGHRVPFIARWPGRIPAGAVSSSLVSNVDMLATLAAIVDRPLDAGEGPDSRDLLPTLLGQSKKPARETLIISPARKSHLAIRKGRWMYIPAQGEGGFAGSRLGEHDFAGTAALKFTGQVNSDVVNGELRENAPKAQLYDLGSDPKQEKNVYDEYPEVVREISTLLREVMDR